MKKTNKALFKATDLASGEMKKVCVEGDGLIAVYRQGDEFFATQDRCTHAAASLTEGWLEGYEVTCPVHEARFDIRNGSALCFPASEALRTFSVTVCEGTVYLVTNDTAELTIENRN